jgi:hypothetical protein
MTAEKWLVTLSNGDQIVIDAESADALLQKLAAEMKKSGPHMLIEPLGKAH